MMSACGPVSTDLDGGLYNQDCLEEADCVVIATGDACTCPATYAAINRRDRARYDSDRDTLLSRCSDARPECPPGEERPVAVCQVNRCEVRFEPYALPSDATP